MTAESLRWVRCNERRSTAVIIPPGRFGRIVDSATTARAAQANEAKFFAAVGRGPGSRLFYVDGALLVDKGDLGFAGF